MLSGTTAQSCEGCVPDFKLYNFVITETELMADPVHTRSVQDLVGDYRQYLVQEPAGSTQCNAIFPIAKTIIPISPLLIISLFHLVFFLGFVLFFLTLFFPVWSIFHPPSEKREKGCNQDSNGDYDFFLHFLLLFLPVMSAQVSRRHHK